MINKGSIKLTQDLLKVKLIALHKMYCSRCDEHIESRRINIEIVYNISDYDIEVDTPISVTEGCILANGTVLTDFDTVYIGVEEMSYEYIHGVLPTASDRKLSGVIGRETYSIEVEDYVCEENDCMDSEEPSYPENCYIHIYPTKPTENIVTLWNTNETSNSSVYIKTTTLNDDRLTYGSLVCDSNPTKYTSSSIDIEHSSSTEKIHLPPFKGV